MIELIVRLLGGLIWFWIYAVMVSVFTSAFRKWATVSRVTTQIHVWVWPYVGPAVVVDLIYAIAHGQLGTIVADVLMLCSWWSLRNWPDDHFKRRRKKITDAVKVLGRRLVVQAAPA